MRKLTDKELQILKEGFYAEGKNNIETAIIQKVKTHHPEVVKIIFKANSEYNDSTYDNNPQLILLTKTLDEVTPKFSLDNIVSYETRDYIEDFSIKLDNTEFNEIIDKLRIDE